MSTTARCSVRPRRLRLTSTNTSYYYRTRSIIMDRLLAASRGSPPGSKEGRARSVPL